MTEVVLVKFKEYGKGYYFKPIDNLKIGDTVIVDTVAGNAMGTVSEGVTEIDDEKIVSTLKRVLRKATDEDLKMAEENKKKEPKAFEICAQKIAESGLLMKLVDVDYSFDASKITFYFTADGRVDFRELVKDLAAHFHTRIELRQIGVRDEARMLGGLGICGYPYCCKQFLEDFEPVSIKMAKEQGLSLNPTKISGSCGRLMCCLKYEQDSYDYLMKITPSLGSTVKTPDGIGTVTDVNLITGNLLVKSKEDDGIIYKFNRKDVKILSSKKKNENTEK